MLHTIIGVKKKKKKIEHSASEVHQLRLTGSKLATPITTPIMATTTTPPAAMLSKKFLREGETAASATSGAIIEAVNAAAVSPVTTFSFMEALT